MLRDRIVPLAVAALAGSLVALLPQGPERTKKAAKQDPVPQAASRPQDPARVLPPVEEPFRTAVERRDLLQRFDAASPIEGFYALRAIHRADGTVARGSGGYAWFGRSHMMLHLSHTPDPRRPAFVQSSVRTYRIEGDVLTMTNLSGHESGGRLAVVQPGNVEVRRFRRAGTVLQIYRGQNSYMEFVRQE